MIGFIKICALTYIVTLQFSDIGAVVYGKVAAPGQFKYQVLLKTRKGNELGICGGAIISERNILTAWHCVEDLGPEHIQVTAGAIGFVNDPNGVSYSVSKIRLHPSKACRNGELRCYDVAMLTTSDPIIYTGYIEEVSLPSTDYEVGKYCVFAGWGVTEASHGPSYELRYGFGRVEFFYNCKYGLAESLNDYEFCFSSVPEDPASINDGDSGTPLVCDGVLTGIIVRGGGRTLYPVTAINVYSVLDFIHNVEEATCQ